MNLTFFHGSDLAEGATAFLREAAAVLGAPGGDPRCLTRSSSEPCARRWGRRNGIPGRDPPRRPHGAHVLQRWSTGTGVDPGRRSTTSSGDASARWGPQASNIGRDDGAVGGLPGRRCPPPPSTGSAGRRSRRCTSPAQAVMAGVGGRRRRRRRRGHEPGADRGRPRPSGLEHGMAHPRGGQGWAERSTADEEISQFRGAGAELIAERWDLSREAMEAVTRWEEPRPCAAGATADGLLAEEIAPVGGRGAGDHADEGTARRDDPGEKLASLAALRAGRSGDRRAGQPGVRRRGGAAASHRRRRAPARPAPRWPGCTPWS